MGSDRKHLLMAIACGLSVMILGGTVLVWPAYRQATAVKAETSELRRKLIGFNNQTTEVEQLARELHEVRGRMERELKVITDSPDVARLMRRLSLPVDGRTVRDQTFTAGSPSLAASGESATEQVLPLTVDMEGTFESVFALIRSAEVVDRLVRVASVQMVANRQEPQAPQPVLTASIGLEVIYDPPSGQGGVAP